MSEKDFSQTTLEESISWTEKNCRFADVRKRIKSRSVAWMLLKHLKEAIIYINQLEIKIKELEQKL